MEPTEGAGGYVGDRYAVDAYVLSDPRRKTNLMLSTTKTAAVGLMSAGVVAVSALALSAPAVAAAPSHNSRPGLLTCTNKVVVRPSTFVLACADYNAELTKTHWTTWGATAASGTTDFGLNLCTPSCAASKISYFPRSTVRVSAPVSTKHHGRLFSSLVVTYRLRGKTHHYSLEWKGSPAFS